MPPLTGAVQNWGTNSNLPASNGAIAAHAKDGRGRPCACPVPPPKLANNISHRWHGFPFILFPPQMWTAPPPDSSVPGISFTPLYFLFVYGRSGLRPSLVQGLRPRNAPLQNHPSSTVRRHSSCAARPKWRLPAYTRCESLNRGGDQGLIKTGWSKQTLHSA